MKIDLVTLAVFAGAAWFFWTRQEAEAAPAGTAPASGDALGAIVQPDALQAAEDFIGDFADLSQDLLADLGQ